MVEDVAAINQFGVVGFMYDNTKTWTNAGVGKPNVFYNGTTLVDVETLTCDDYGSASYEPLQGWSNSKKYAFFAYYPYDLTNYPNVTIVNTDGTAYIGGTPAIKYTMNSGDLKSSMVDVMTAMQTDKYWKSSTDNNITDANGHTNVQFSFAHRMSCIELKISNSSECLILINSVKVIISGIAHNEIIMPLDGTNVIKNTLATPLSAELSLNTNETSGVDTVDPSDYIEFTDKLIFIPQTEPVSIRVEVNYDRYSSDFSAGYEDHTLILPAPDQVAMSTILQEGKKHQVQLNFTDSNVEISGVANIGWVPQSPVTDTFN